MPGPVPKRSSERVRRNKVVPPTKISAVGGVAIPELGFDDPHPLVVEMWEAQHRSAQSQFMELSDWVHFKLAMELLDRQLKGSRLNANLIQTIESMLGSHGMAEGHRRRLRIEVERQVEAPVAADVADMFRRKMMGAG